MSLKSGHKIVELSPEQKKQADRFKGRANNTIKLEPDGWCLLAAWKKFGDGIYDFKLDPNDVFVNTLPKSGTTWTQEIVWTLRNNPNLDNPAGNLPLAARTPTLEADFVIDHLHKPKSLIDAVDANNPTYDKSKGLFLAACDMLPKPRTIKCHLPLPLLSPKLLDTCKVVYVIRDPRDVCLSHHHHSRVFDYDGFDGTLDEYIDAFIDGTVLWSPFWPHIKYAWENRNHPNMFITYYEEMKRNTKEEYKKMAKFLDVNVTEEQLDRIIHHTSFGEMKKRDDHVLPSDDAVTYMDIDRVKKEGGFFRKGTSGGWRTNLNDEQKKKFDDWITENCPDMEIMKNIEGKKRTLSNEVSDENGEKTEESSQKKRKVTSADSDTTADTKKSKRVTVKRS